MNDEGLVWTDTEKPKSIRARPSAAVAVPDQEGTKVVKTIVIQRTIDDVFRALDLQRLTRHIFPIQSIEKFGMGQFRWTLKFPDLDRPIDWICEIMRDKPNRMFSWKTMADSDVASAGSVWLRELACGRGTELRLMLKYDFPNEYIESDFEAYFGISPQRVIAGGLRKFKALLEAGEIPTITGQPRGGKTT